jgi:aspartyl-tRNA(Asn)/glutamyl-tRNA(Gln) amidotransferase subunit A
MNEWPIEGAIRPRRPIRIGVIRGFFYENATAEIRTLNDALVNNLAASGFEVGEVRLPGIFEIQQSILRTILRSETSSIHQALFAKHPEAYGPKLRMLVETGMLVSAADYLRAKRLRRKYQREMAQLFENFDVLLTPAAPGTAPPGIMTTGDPVMNGPWTLSDFPIMTLPYALGANGLPIGMQLTVPPLKEGLLLEIAEQIETLIGFRSRAASASSVISAALLA